MIPCFDYTCPNRNINGYCNVTACSRPSLKPIYNTTVISSETIKVDTVDKLIFPHTIGDITFYSSKELIKWVEDQQKINKNPDYGIGNWA